MKKNKEHIIWTSYDDENALYNDIKENWKERFDSEPTDREIYDEVADLIEQYRGDEIMNLDRPLEHRLIVIANVGTWHGRFSGYQIIKSRNLNGIFNMRCSEGDLKFYVEGHDIHFTNPHHDATTYGIIREFVGDEDTCPMLEAIANQKDYKKYLSRYTRCLGKRVREIYGW